MAAFSSYYNHAYMPFPVDPLVFPSPSSINTSFKLSSDDHLPQPTAAGNLNSLFGPSDLPGNAIFVKDMDGISRQISAETSAAYKKQSTTTTESSSAAALDDDKVDGGGGDQLSQGPISATAAVNNRRRKTRNCSTLSSGQSKDEGEGGKAKRQKNKKEKKGSNEGKQEKKGREDPPKDYIHVRARRGQATDSHSLAERVRREKISERMRTLQKLVPGCDKVTGKALMLDEIINYVQSLQNQVEFLSMKLASLSPVFYDFGVDLDAFIVRPEGMVGMATSNTPHGQHMGQRQTTTAFTDATIAAAIATTTTTPLSASPHFSSLFDHSSSSPLLLPQNSLLLPLSQDNINGSVLKNVEEQRHNKFLNTTGLFNSLCSFN